MIIQPKKKSPKECKVLKDYSEKYAAQRTHEEERYGRKKRGNIVKFNKNTEKMNSIDTSAVPNKKGKKRNKTHKSEPEVAASKEDDHTYGIDCLNLSGT